MKYHWKLQQFRYARIQFCQPRLPKCVCIEILSTHFSTHSHTLSDRQTNRERQDRKECYSVRDFYGAHRSTKKAIVAVCPFSVQVIAMEESNRGISSDFKDAADEIFGTLLTITTILSGVYISITFGWFGQAMIEPHPGEPMRPEMLAQAITGITLGLIFIVPLVFILVSWALSKFRNSAAWGTAAWSGLIYCLVQDFIGVVALFSFYLIATAPIIGLSMIAVGAFVLLPPPILGTLIGYRIGMKYSQSTQKAERGKRRRGTPAVVMVLLILVVQALLVGIQLI